MPPTSSGPPTCDLAVIFTVWRRGTLDAYFRYFERQDLFAKRGLAFRTCIIVFQNGVHLNVTDIVAEWSIASKWGARSVTVTHVQSVLASGYYGRFLAPLLAPVRDDSYFIVCDDDIIFGAFFLSSMMRVVDSGDVATRNGRFVTYGNDTDGKFCIIGDSGGASEGGWYQGLQVATEMDILYDYGGHMWAGRISWLRSAWSLYPPSDVTTAEDFWLSATLKSKLGISTKRVRCPVSDVEFCACSMHVAHEHQPVEVGTKVGGEWDARALTMVKHIQATGYVNLPQKARTEENKSLIFGHFWDTSGESIFNDCLFFT